MLVDWWKLQRQEKLIGILMAGQWNPAAVDRIQKLIVENYP